MVSFLLLDPASLDAQRLALYKSIYGNLGENAFSRACVLSERVMPIEQPASMPHIEFVKEWYQAVTQTSLAENETLENVLIACNKEMLTQQLIMTIFSNMQQEYFFVQWDDMMTLLQGLKLPPLPLTEEAINEILLTLDLMIKTFLKPLLEVLTGWNKTLPIESPMAINFLRRYVNAVVECAILSQDALSIQDQLHYRRFYQIALVALLQGKPSYQSFVEQLRRTYFNPQQYAEWTTTLIPLDTALFGNLVPMLLNEKDNKVVAQPRPSAAVLAAAPPLPLPRAATPPAQSPVFSPARPGALRASHAGVFPAKQPPSPSVRTAAKGPERTAFK